jgi:branched-chain amino acid transport system substrate-binding protein
MVACGPAAPGEKAPIKIGAIIPYTGPGSATVQYIEASLDYCLEGARWEVAGRQIELLKEDETPDPTVAVAKAKKLVEEDKVNVIIGPLLGHTADAVSAYLEGSGIPHIYIGSAMLEHTGRAEDFMPSLLIADYIPLIGHYAYDVLGYRTASLLYADYAYGYWVVEAFTAGFTERGGSIIQEQAVPMEELEMPPYIAAIKKTADCVATMLVGPASVNFPRQAKEYGLDMPILVMAAAPLEEPVLAQIGDAGLGMISTDLYSPLINTPENQRFVKEYADKCGIIPGFQAHAACVAVSLYLEALRATGGDTTWDKISEAMRTIEFTNPQGSTVKMKSGGTAITDAYILECVKIDDRYAWKPILTIPEVGK